MKTATSKAEAELDAVHAFVVESNYFLRALHYLAVNQDVSKTPLADMRSYVKSWFAKLDSAYAAACDDDTRTVLGAMSGLLADRDKFLWHKADGGCEDAELRRLCRDPLGIFLRDFEAALRAVATRMAALAVKMQRGIGPVPRVGVRATSVYDSKANRIVKFLRRSSAYKNITEIANATGFDRRTVRNRLEILADSGDVKKLNDRHYTAKRTK